MKLVIEFERAQHYRSLLPRPTFLTSRPTPPEMTLPMSLHGYGMESCHVRQKPRLGISFIKPWGSYGGCELMQRWADNICCAHLEAFRSTGISNRPASITLGATSAPHLDRIQQLSGISSHLTNRFFDIDTKPRKRPARTPLPVSIWGCCHGQFLWEDQSFRWRCA